MAATPVDVVGSTPISFTGKNGQRFVPLRALQFNGSALELKSDWATYFDPTETQTLIALATSLAAAGDLTPPPVPPPLPALVFTATHPGPESNNIVVTAVPDPGPPLTAAIAVSAVEKDTYPSLASASAAAQAIGVDVPSGKPGAAAQGTGLVVVQASSVASGTALPADGQSGAVTHTTGFDVLDSGKSVLFTVLARSDYTGSGMSVSVNLDQGGTSFTLTATYDSSKESGPKPKITILTLDQLPGAVSYLVAASAPPAGAAVPSKDPAKESVQLTGGGPKLFASGLLFTS